MQGSIARTRHDAAGIGYMVAGSALITLNDAIAKWLTASYPVGQILCIRGAFFFVPILFFIWRAGGTKALRVHSISGQLGRAALFITASAFFVTSVGLMPLPTVIALTFTGPFFVTALAPTLLGEHVGWRRWLAVLVGFAGVLIIVRPFHEDWSWVAVLPVIGALCGALRDMATRQITARETSESILFYGALAVVVVGLATSPFGWQWVAPFDLMLFAVQGLAMGIAHYLMIESFRLSEAALVAPFKYTGFIWAVLYGAVLWGDYPDRWTILGALVILASGLYILQRELLRRKA
ncbi:MAG TPA: DMT family transporter [Alphaproteobacteria bacterium]|nr:DMT family transporter [Alphaproteobacteria bacterium]